MSRLVRAVRPAEDETVLVLGGEGGAVTLHVSLCGVPEWMALHSPVRLPGTDQSAGGCPYLEMPCWCAGSIRGSDLAVVMKALGATGGEDDEETWTLMAGVYRTYLETGRR